MHRVVSQGVTRVEHRAKFQCGEPDRASCCLWLRRAVLLCPLPFPAPLSPCTTSGTLIPKTALSGYNTGVSALQMLTA